MQKNALFTYFQKNTTMDNSQTKKCQSRQCRTCSHMEECNFFFSNTTGQRYIPKNYEGGYLDCRSENIIYLIFCKICNFQYVGETKNRLQTRFSKHKSDIRLGNSCQIIHKHFEESGHGIDNCKILPIEKVDRRPASHQGLGGSELDRAITKFRLEREKYWIKTLQTAYPFGLNSRVKGIGDFTPSQGEYQNFGGRRRRRNRRHNKRKPKRLRGQIEVSLDFIIRKHQELENNQNYIHYFKTYLYNLPRCKLEDLRQEVQQNPNVNERIKDMIIMICNLRLFKPVQISQKSKREFYHINFRDKGLDFINLSGILRTQRVVDKIPNYFHEKDPPIIGYKFNKSIAGLLFNYKQSLSEEVINDYEEGNIRCNCQGSRFKDEGHGHVITGDLDIVENIALKNLIKKGPKYRLPQRIDWEKDKDIIIDFLEMFMDKWVAKERKNHREPIDIGCLDSWKREVMNIVENKIRAGRARFGKTWTMRIEGALKTELDRLKDKFVITVTDKAQSNILFTCKYFYIKNVKEELNRPGQMTYEAINTEQALINSHIVNFSKSKGIKVPENMIDVPLIYWIPKMHKNPIGSRFIAGSKSCSIKLLSKNFSKALKLILNHMKLYSRTVFERTNLNHYWILENSLEFMEDLKNKNINHMETYDFSTLYTALPHEDIKVKFSGIFNKVFKREAKPYINVGYSKTYFSASKNKNGCSFTVGDMMEILDFILDNIFVKCGKDIFKQIIGIPIGLDSGQDIANLLLFSYESTYVENLAKTNIGLARKFNFCKRYIDDLFVGNFPNFKDHIYQIYPRELEIKRESNNIQEVAYLDLKLKSENNMLTFSLYDKRDNFSFEIVNFPYIDSCIPKKSAMGVFTSQLIRYARICSEFTDFKGKSISLIKKLRNQGYCLTDLRRLILRFYNEKTDIINKYNIVNGNTFIRQLLEGMR